MACGDFMEYAGNWGNAEQKPSEYCFRMANVSQKCTRLTVRFRCEILHLLVTPKKDSAVPYICSPSRQERGAAAILSALIKHF